MKKLLFFAVMALLAINFTACDDNEHMHDEDGEFQYHVHIHQPTADDKKVGDMLDIKVDFESMAEKTIHHAKVRIYNKADDTEIYNQPEEAHVHQEDGVFLFEDQLILDATSGVEAHTDWVLEAKVWGHEEGKEEVIETVEFHVHPN